MKRELASRLLQSILPNVGDEGAAAALFRRLQFLADYKYNKYEMYHAGRLFLENLYLWLDQFMEDERPDALQFVLDKLVFISRLEFQQLARVVYDRILWRQTEVAAELASVPVYKTRSIRESKQFSTVTRASLYVGMSDGARIDFVRRQNLSISNEQVLPYYETSPEKRVDLIHELRASTGDPSASFQCLFLLDDFCGSGRTLLREVVQSRYDSADKLSIPKEWESRLRHDAAKSQLELLYSGTLSAGEETQLRGLADSEAYRSACDILVSRAQEHQTVLKGALVKVTQRDWSLSPSASVSFCPLLITRHALSRLEPLIRGLPAPFNRMQILAGAVLESSDSVVDVTTPMGRLCDKYYLPDLGDRHTGSVKFGFDGCGLPLVLHHNTPNNSIYLLWARTTIQPLFVRHERHGRERG